MKTILANLTKSKDLTKVIGLLTGIFTIVTLVGLATLIDSRTSTHANQEAIKTEKIRQAQLAEDAKFRKEEREVSAKFQSLVDEVAQTQGRFLAIVLLSEQKAAKDNEREAKRQAFVVELRSVLKQLQDTNNSMAFENKKAKMIIDMNFLRGKINGTTEAIERIEDEVLPYQR